MSNTVSLENRIGTKYVINALQGPLREILEDCMKNNLTLDLADCKFGPDCASALSDFYGKVDLICSTNDTLNSILKNNAIQSVKMFEPYEEYKFPEKCDFKALLESYNTFKAGEKWCIRVDGADKRKISFATMLIMMLPEVEFDIGSCYNAFADFIRPLWLMYAKSHEKYWEFSIDGIFIREVDSNGFMGTGKYGNGRLPERVYIRDQNCIPYEFGNKYLLEFDENDNPIGEWRMVISECIKILTQKPAPKGPTLKDFVKLRKD